ncbi:flavin reductase [Maridesulfovibrio sp.]|uniref:flavin reductase n=1 Tax=Maridesulfovibrio sp. TaxID=2795000 RepID=UPI002A1890E2|nr:flavin reductase [Maridesulfovibrio sp.]
MGIAHTLLGGHVDGRPDYLPLVAKPRINSKLSLVAIEIEKGSELHARIMDDAKFSLNIFSGNVLDCLGLTTSLSDKNKCCDGRCVSFYGESDGAPMLEVAPLSLECRIYETVDLNESSFVMAEIISIWTKGVSLKDDYPQPTVENQPIHLSAMKGRMGIIPAF